MTEQLPAPPDGVTPDQWFRAIAIMAVSATDANSPRTIKQMAESIARYIKTGEYSGY